MGFAKMGLRFLSKRKVRTAMTIFAIILGVGILTGVNVTADSIEVAINDQINSTLGNTDIIVRGNGSIDGGWFRYDSARDAVDDIDGVKKIVPRITKSHPSSPSKNQTSGLNILTIGIQTSNPSEEGFGVCNITKALDPSYENTSRIEDLFLQFSDEDLPVVISKDYSNRYGIEPGDPYYIYPEDPEFFGGMDAFNSSTWFNATVIGVIEDTSESVQDFQSPAKVWQLYPSSIAVYIDLDTAWAYIFNSHRNYVNMMFVQVNDQTETEQIRNEIEDLDDLGIFPGEVFTENAKSIFTEGILQVNFLMRGIFSIFSAISLLVCAIIIKNLLEMAKEEQTHEIGVMRAIGVTKQKIMVLYVSQILFISIVGSLLGLWMGYYLSNIFLNSYVDTASAVGTDFSNYTITPVMSWLTVAIGLGAGITVSMIFGLIPARSAANVDPLEALRSKSERPKDTLIVRTIKKTGSLTVSLVFLIGGIVIVGSTFGGLFILDIINPNIIVLLFIGVIMLIIGIVLVVGFFFPVIVPTISALFQPLLKETRTITARNLTRYSRQSKNTFAMLAIGICMMITVGTIMNSAYEGAYPGGKTITGGDIAIGDLYRGHVAKDPHTEGLRALPSVKEVVPIRFSLGFEGITRVDRLTNDEDIFGGIADSVFGPVTEAFNLAILDPTDYGSMHSHDSIVKLDTKDLTLSRMMELLEDPYSVIIQDDLAQRMGNVKEGEWLRIRFEGFEADFKVVGIFEILPGFYTTYYSTSDAFDKQFSGAISWNAYTQLMNDNLGQADVIVKNKVTPGEDYAELLPDENMWGYVSTPIDYQTIESLVYQTGLVQNSTRRINSPFWGIPPFRWQTNITLYDPNVNLSDYSASPLGEEYFDPELGEILNQTWALQNVLWHEDNAINLDWNDMLSRAIVINPETDSEFGNTTIRSIISDIPDQYNSTLEDIFEWATENLDEINPCIVNEIYVNLNLSTGEWNYVKKFVPGETIRMYYNDTIYTDFTVVATTNSHYQYEYVDEDGNHFGDTAVFNYEALSYNSYLYNSSDWDYFFEVVDLEPNTIFLPSNGYELPDEFTESLIPSIINQILNNETTEFNETTGYTDEVATSWINQTLQSIFLGNISDYSGEVNTTEWIGNYTYEDSTFSFDGAQFSYLGETQTINFTVDLNEQGDYLEQLAAGNYNLTLENFTSSLMIDLNDNMTLADIQVFIETMESICRTIPNLENITFFSPRTFLLEDSGLFDVYFLIGAESKGQLDSALLEIENYYMTHGLTWKSNYVDRANETEEDVGGILGLITSMFFGVLSFALITSLLGLAISTVISVKKRYAEIGTLRTLGFSNKQILKMVVGEGVITAIIGILVGVLAGLVVAGLIIYNLPFMIFLPIIFAPPYELIGWGIVALIIASMGVSFIPAVSAVKIDIAEAIRTKGE